MSSAQCEVIWNEQWPNELQLSAVIARSNITWFCIWYNNDWDKICIIRGYIHKRHPIARPHGRAMGCVCEDLSESWPRYNGTALYEENVCNFTVNSVPSDGQILFLYINLTRELVTLLPKCLISLYSDVIMGAIASQITGVSIVNLTVCSDVDQRKHQSSASLAFVMGIHRRPVNFPHKRPVTREMFPFDDVIVFFFVGKPPIQQLWVFEAWRPR